jgi:hypothetical protein
MRIMEIMRNAQNNVYMSAQAWYILIMNSTGKPTTLTEAIRYYSDTQTCINAVAMLRWQDGSPICPSCNAAQGERNHYWLKTQARWKCYSCRKQFSVKVGTIFEDSPLGLDIWLVAPCLSGCFSKPQAVVEHGR